MENCVPQKFIPVWSSKISHPQKFFPRKLIFLKFSFWMLDKKK